MRMSYKEMEKYLEANNAKIAQTRTMQTRDGKWQQVVSVATPEMGEKEGWIIIKDSTSDTEQEAIEKGYEVLFGEPYPQDEPEPVTDDLPGVVIGAPDGE